MLKWLSDKIFNRWQVLWSALDFYYFFGPETFIVCPNYESADFVANVYLDLASCVEANTEDDIYVFKAKNLARLHRVLAKQFSSN